MMMLLVKHAICDLALQPASYPGEGKRKYFGLHAHLKHYIPHGVGTFIVLMLFTDWQTSLFFAVVDYLAHWHIDYTKTGFVRRANLNRTKRRYWVYNAIDQIAHYLTYWVIAIKVFT